MHPRIVSLDSEHIVSMDLEAESLCRKEFVDPFDSYEIKSMEQC